MTHTTTTLRMAYQVTWPGDRGWTNSTDHLSFAQALAWARSVIAMGAASADHVRVNGSPMSTRV